MTIKTLYNDDCPICRFEISHYRSYCQRTDLPLRFEDLNATDLDAWGLTKDQAERRLYVLKDGKLFSGIPAFLEIWREMPRYRFLARIIGLPGIRQIASLGYDYVLAPLVYANVQRRKRGHKKRGSA